MSDYTANAVGPVSASSPGTAPFIILFNIVDLAVTNKTANTVDNIFDVFAGDYVVNVSAEVITAEGGTLTFDVGDGDDVDGYIDGANGNATGWNGLSKILAEATPNTVVGNWGGGKIYTADDTIDVKWLNDADAGKVKFRAVVIRAQGPDTL